MKVMTTEMLVRQLGRLNAEIVVEWLTHKYEEKKEKMARSERADAEYEQAGAKFLAQLIQDVKGNVNAKQTGNSTVSTGGANGS